MTYWVSRFDQLIDGYEDDRRRMVAAVRQAYLSGRWQAATPAERAATRRNFLFNRRQRLRAIRLRAGWIADHPE